MRRRRLLVALLVLAPLTGCGNDRTLPPDVSKPSLPARERVQLRYPGSGIAYRAPSNWRAAPGVSPLVSTLVSGTATVAVWRYQRKETLPASAKDLGQARKDLVAAVKLRDPHAKVGKGKVTKVRGKDAILLYGTERVAGRLRRVRSLHVFQDKSEVVVDAYAPPAAFRVLDRAVFLPLIRSLRITAPRAGKDKPPA